MGTKESLWDMRALFSSGADLPKTRPVIKRGKVHEPPTAATEQLWIFNGFLGRDSQFSLRV